MNIDNIVNEQFRGKSFRELADAPLSALRGIGEEQAKALADTLGVKTIGDLASLQAIRFRSTPVSPASKYRPRWSTQAAITSTPVRSKKQAPFAIARQPKSVKHTAGQD
jgi:hypothetical protein